MPKYHATLAADMRCYTDITIEADSIEDALEAAKTRFEDVVFTPSDHNDLTDRSIVWLQNDDNSEELVGIDLD